MNSRSAGMLSQMRERRAERKKPKRFVALKKVSLDPTQQRNISTGTSKLAKAPHHAETYWTKLHCIFSCHGFSWPYRNFHWSLRYCRSD